MEIPFIGFEVMRPDVSEIGAGTNCEQQNDQEAVEVENC